MTTTRVQSLKLSDQVDPRARRPIVNGDIGVTDVAPTEQDICAEFLASRRPPHAS